MKILVVSNFVPSTQNPVGGSFVAERIRGIRANGHKTLTIPVQVFTNIHVIRGVVKNRSVLRPALRYDLDSHTAVLITRGAVHHHLFINSRFLSSHLKNYTFLTDRSDAIANELVEELTDLDWDIVVGHGAYGIPAAGIARSLGDLLSIPYVPVAHGSDINYLTRAQYSYISEIFSEAPLSFYVSDALRQRAASIGFSTDRAIVTPNGVNTDIFVPPEGPIERDDPQLLYVGNLMEVKGVDRLPSIMREVWRTHPSANLTIVGSGHLESSLRREFIGQNARFAGRLDRAGVASEMAQADVLILPSRSEGWPTVVLEAQACGTPTVATDVGGSGEAVGTCGAVVPENPFNPALFAAAVSDSLVEHDRQAVRRRALNFDWKVLGQREAEHLERVAFG